MPGPSSGPLIATVLAEVRRIRPAFTPDAALARSGRRIRTLRAVYAAFRLALARMTRPWRAPWDGGDDPRRRPGLLLPGLCRAGSPFPVSGEELGRRLLDTQ